MAPLLNIGSVSEMNALLARAPAVRLGPRRSRLASRRRRSARPRPGTGGSLTPLSSPRPGLLPRPSFPLGGGPLLGLLERPLRPHGPSHGPARRRPSRGRLLQGASSACLSFSRHSFLGSTRRSRSLPPPPARPLSPRRFPVPPPPLRARMRTHYSHPTSHKPQRRFPLPIIQSCPCR